MDLEAADRYGAKRVHQRLGPSHSSSRAGDRYNQVCNYWLAGRCTRHPCLYLHSELPQSLDGPASAKRAHHQNSHQGRVWRNPNPPGNAGPPSKWGKGPGAGGSGPRPQVNTICNHFMAGNCKFGEKCKNLHSWFVGDSLSLLTPLQGHQKVITGIALPSGSDKLYTGSHDETVRVWDCQSGQCVGTVNVGGEVGCMIDEGPWIFVGIPNAIKAWNTHTSTDLNLDGPIGQVYAMGVANGMLFAGIQDGRILAWKFSAVTNCFEPAASLTGHQRAVVSLYIAGGRLYSGSMDHTIRVRGTEFGHKPQSLIWIFLFTSIKVWDLTTLQSIQTLSGHTNVVMSLLWWDQFLLSGSLDKTIKVWVANESGNLEVTFTHNEEHGVLTLFGMPDAQSKPVLFCACNDNSLHIYDLPSFSERGKIFAKEEIRSIQAGPGGLFFTGDGTGELKVWKWLANEPGSA